MSWLIIIGTFLTSFMVADVFLVILGITVGVKKDKPPHLQALLIAVGLTMIMAGVLL